MSWTYENLEWHRMPYEAQGHHKEEDEEDKAEESCKAEIGNCRPREDSTSDRLGKIEDKTMIDITPSGVILTAENPTAAASFYSALLGWKVSDKYAPDGIDVCLLYGRTVAGISPQMGGLGSKWRVYVNVADIKETAKAVFTAGGKVIQETTLGNLGSFAVFADPFGTEFAVRQGENKVTSAPNRLGTFAWTELITDDLLAVSKFYGDLFGWTLGAPLPGDQLGHREWLANGRPIAGLLPRPPAMPKEIPPYWDVFFEVADLAATVEKAVRLGGRNLMPPIDIPHGRIAVFGDPAGTVFSVIKPKTGTRH
jgi:uncharacterized protein